MTAAALLALLALLPIPTGAEQVDCPEARSVHPDAAGCADKGRVRIQPGLSATDYRNVLGHETGHQVDFQLMTDTDRDTFRRINNDRGEWHTANGVWGAEERWAEAFDFCTMPHRIRVRVGWAWNDQTGRLDGPGYGWVPTRRRVAASCALVRTILIGSPG